MSSPTGLTYQWKKNGVIIPGATSNILNIPSALDVDDNSVFEVVVTNLNGSVSSYRANLDVLRKVKIVEHPISQTVTTGQTVTLYVKVSGDGPFVFLWRKDGALISETYVDSYTISNITLADAGNYNVLVKNDFSQAMSNVAAITVLEKPEIIINPSITTIQIDPVINITKVIPEKIKFDLNVSAKGTPPLSTQWRKDGVDIPRATNNLLTLTSPLTSDSGIYDAVVRNVVGEDISARYELKVLAPPRITVQPVLPPKVILGDNVTFTATATGSPVLKYQWRKNNTDIDSANSTSYTVQAIPQNYGDYTLYVSNEVGNTVSVKVSLTDANVLKKPEIIKHPVSLITRVGGMATFTVTATGSPTLTYQWKKGDTNIIGANFATFTINPVSLSNAGDYNVIVSNPAGSAVSNFATLSVGVAPTIITQPSSVNVIINNNTEFNVVASGTEVLTYQWRKNSVDIPNATLSSFPIFNVQAADVANYDVVIRNDYGSLTSTKATLTILYPPKITLNPVGSTSIAGTKINLVAAATGTNPLQYQWRFNGENISGATTTSYDKITSFSLQNEGVYDIVVSNSVGSVTSLPATLKLVKKAGVADVNLVGAISTRKYFDSLKNLVIDAVLYRNTNTTVSVELSGTEPIFITYFIQDALKNNLSTKILSAGDSSVVISPALSTDNTVATKLFSDGKIYQSKNFVINFDTSKYNPCTLHISLSNLLYNNSTYNYALNRYPLININFVPPPLITIDPYTEFYDIKARVSGTQPLTCNWFRNNVLVQSSTAAIATELNGLSSGDFKLQVVDKYGGTATSKTISVSSGWFEISRNIITYPYYNINIKCMDNFLVDYSTQFKESDKIKAFIGFPDQDRRTDSGLGTYYAAGFISILNPYYTTLSNPDWNLPDQSYTRVGGAIDASNDGTFYCTIADYSTFSRVISYNLKGSSNVINNTTKRDGYMDFFSRSRYLNLYSTISSKSSEYPPVKICCNLDGTMYVATYKDTAFTRIYNSVSSVKEIPNIVIDKNEFINQFSSSVSSSTILSWTGGVSAAQIMSIIPTLNKVGNILSLLYVIKYYRFGITTINKIDTRIPEKPIYVGRIKTYNLINDIWVKMDADIPWSADNYFIKCKLNDTGTRLVVSTADYDSNTFGIISSVCKITVYDMIDNRWIITATSDEFLKPLYGGTLKVTNFDINSSGEDIFVSVVTNITDSSDAQIMKFKFKTNKCEYHSSVFRPEFKTYTEGYDTYTVSTTKSFNNFSVGSSGNVLTVYSPYAYVKSKYDSSTKKTTNINAGVVTFFKYLEF